MSKKKRTLKDILGLFRNDPNFDDISDNLKNMDMFDETNKKNVEEGEDEDGNKWRRESYRDEDGVYKSKIVITTNPGNIDMDNFFEGFEKQMIGFDDAMDNFDKSMDKFFNERNDTFKEFNSKRIIKAPRSTTLEQLSEDALGNLKKKLNNAVEEERFEDAAKLRDMINNYKNDSTKK